MSSSNKIVLRSSDGETFVIDETVGREFQIIAHMIEDDCAGKEIPIQNVTGKILALVIVYCKKHVEAGSVDEDEDAKTKLENWDAKFMRDVDLGTIIKLLLAANYLNIKTLLNLACQTIADHIKDKTPEDIRAIFNIENDYTPEEEEKVREENKWAFE